MGTCQQIGDVQGTFRESVRDGLRVLERRVRKGKWREGPRETDGGAVWGGDCAALPPARCPLPPVWRTEWLRAVVRARGLLLLTQLKGEVRLLVCAERGYYPAS